MRVLDFTCTLGVVFYNRGALLPRSEELSPPHVAE